MENPLPVAVIGCGRMGRLHARVYSQMPRVKLVAICDADADAAAAVAEEFGGKACSAPDQLPLGLAAVTIAVPTKFHPDIALPLLKRGVACLIEKPLASSTTEAQRIVNAGKEGKALIQVGHIERFNPAVRAMTRLGIKPRFMEVTRISPLTFRSIDVGVVLDMMIHDIDIVLQLAGSAAAKIDAVGVSVIGQVEDICNARITFANGCVANLTASRLAMKTERKLRVFSMDAYVSIDYQKKYGIFVRRTGNVDSIRDTVAKIRSGEIEDLTQLNFADLVNIEELQIDDIEPLRAELDSFIDAVTGKAPAPVTGEDGLAAVELAERIVAAVKENPLGSV
jgi:predicted dehydrogenase